MSYLNRNLKSLADGGYASAQNFHDAALGGHELLTPPPAPWRDISRTHHSAHFKHDRTNNRMICPEGRSLSHQRRRIKDGRELDIYGKRGECDGCPARGQCTKSKHNRSVEVPVNGYEELVRRREEWEKKEVKEQYAKRAGIIEPVFAQIKNVMGFRRWAFKGLEKVKAQWQMLCASWNLKVIIRHWRAQFAS